MKIKLRSTYFNQSLCKKYKFGTAFLEQINEQIHFVLNSEKENAIIDYEIIYHFYFNNTF